MKILPLATVEMNLEDSGGDTERQIVYMEYKNS
jgi:hypothetical protein